MKEICRGDLIRWYDHYAEGDIVRESGTGIVIGTRTYTYAAPDNCARPVHPLYACGDGGFGLTEATYVDAPVVSHTHYLIYKTEHQISEWMPREWIALLQLPRKKKRKQKQ